MAGFLFNIAKGRVAELYNRVKQNDPATARLVIIPLEATGLEDQATLQDKTTITELLAGTTNEQTTMGRKYLTDADISALAPDQVNDRMDVDIPDITWTAATGNAIGGVVIAYDPDQSGDGSIIPLAHFTFAITPDGSDVVAVVNAAGFYRAS